MKGMNATIRLPAMSLTISGIANPTVGRNNHFLSERLNSLARGVSVAKKGGLGVLHSASPHQLM